MQITMRQTFLYCLNAYNYASQITGEHARETKNQIKLFETLEIN